VLIRRDGDGAFAIGQLSHAWLAGQLARAWGNSRFGEVQRLEEVVLGAQQHDIGWAEFDLHPQLNPDTGLPRSFLEASVEDHLSVWRAAPERLLTQSTYAALVVSMHGAWLSELRARAAPEHAEALNAHIEAERARQARLCEALGVSDREKERAQRQVATWDRLSLVLCNAWPPSPLEAVPTAHGVADIRMTLGEDGAWSLDPWPFRAPCVEVQCEARRLCSAYSDEAAMRRDYADAVPLTLSFVLRGRASVTAE